MRCLNTRDIEVLHHERSCWILAETLDAPYIRFDMKEERRYREDRGQGREDGAQGGAQGGQGTRSALGL